METILSNSLDYVIISKKYFTRLVLTYEVLPLSLCHSTNDSPIISAQQLAYFKKSYQLTGDLIVLELNNAKRENVCFLPLGAIEKLWFDSQESLELFLERNYENYDVNQLDCAVLHELSVEANAVAKELVPAKRTNKASFSGEMAEIDALLTLIHQYLCAGIDSDEAVSQMEAVLTNKNEVLKKLLPIPENDPDALLAQEFFMLCCCHGIDDGWDMQSVIDSFDKTVTNEIKELDSFSTWITTVSKIANNEGVNIAFTDESHPVLRAMTLTLLNPEIEQIKAMKLSRGDDVGDNVYRLACAFALARTGYSFFTDKERQRAGDNRVLLQQINAQLHNLDHLRGQKKVHHEQPQPAQIIDHEVAGKVDTLKLTDHEWLMLDNYGEDTQVFEIEGIKPLAGFDLKLLHRGPEFFSLRIIDAGGPKGMTKFAGQMVKDMINIQGELPKECRFETCDKGVHLILPIEWSISSDLKAQLKELLIILKPLKLQQKSSSFA